MREASFDTLGGTLREITCSYRGYNMGIYRFFLAILVLLSHIGIAFYGREIGVFAVVSFFLLSGYVMTALIDRHYSDRSRINTFYLDRVMRLFPQFIFYLCATLVMAAIAHPTSPYLSDLTPSKILLNLLMVPLNFFQYFPGAQIIPQAWSLGLESQFYIAIPLILVFGLRTPVFLASFAFFLLAYFGVLNSDTWGYRMLPGTFFMFLFGSFIYRRTDVRVVTVAYITVCALFAWVVSHPSLQFPYTLEVLAGLIFGIPVVRLLAKVNFGPLEDFAGNLSYGVFLNHFFVIWSFEVAGIKSNEAWYPYALISASTLLAAASYMIVERPAIAFRHSIRNRSVFASART